MALNLFNEIDQFDHNSFGIVQKSLYFYRSTSTLSPDELAAQSRSIWPTPTIVLLFSPQFKLINLNYLDEQYNFYGVIASGAFGTVYRVIDRNDRKEYALKALEKSQVHTKNRQVNTYNSLWL